MNAQENKINNPNKSNCSPLVSLLGFIAWLIFAIGAYGIASLFNNSLWPLNWGGRSAFVVATIGLMTAWMLLIYLEQQKILSIERCIKKHFDLDEYVREPKKPLDAILCHYTNVATIGLFLAVSIYATRPIIEWSEPVGGGLLAILITLAFFIYALFLLRLAKRFVGIKNVAIYLFILVSVFLVDSKAVEMLIKSAPTQTQQMAPEAQPNR